MFFNTLSNTLYTAVIVTLGTLLLGYPVALALVRSKRLAPLILVMVLLPFWTSVLVRTYAWMVLLGRHGLINEALLASGLIERPLRILNTLARRLYRHDPHPAALHDPAGRQRAPANRSVAGARRRRASARRRGGRFLQITLPLSVPGVAAGGLLVFVLSLGFYITPAMLGGPRDITLSMLIANQVDQLNWAYAACLSAVLLATALVIIAVCRRLPGIGNAFKMSAR